MASHSYTTDNFHLPVVSPGRRQRAAQPPTLLTTSLNNSAYGHHSQGHISVAGNTQAPASASSLSTPFSLHSASPYTPSPGGAVPSAMATRGPVALPSTSYNPQEWARPDGLSPIMPASASMSPRTGQQSSQRPTYAPRLRGPDEPMASPPPPYSASPEPAQSSPADTPSSATDHMRRAVSGSASMLSPAPMAVSLGLDRRSPSHATDVPGWPGINTVNYPPPPASSSVRSTSRNHADRLLSAINGRQRGPSSPSPNAIDMLHQHTAQLIHAVDQGSVSGLGPPASRRAASTGAIGTAFGPRSPNGSGPDQDLEITIPPPPPGPPPATMRSQSASRAMGPSAAGQSAGTSLAPSHQRQPLARGSDLGPVPPTPADWVEEDLVSVSRPEPYTSHQIASPAPETRPWQRPLHIQTADVSRAQLTESPSSADMNSGAAAVQRVRRDSGGLMRSPAVRNRSAQGLRERRSASKRRMESEPGDSENVEDSGDPLSKPLKDLVIANDASAKRRTSKRTPRTGSSFQGLEEALRSGEIAVNSAREDSAREESARSTPRADASLRSIPSSKATPPTSPFSASRSGPRPSPAQTRWSAASSSGQRPLSHILHMPNDEAVKITPLSPESNHSLMEFDRPESPNTFADRAAERHRIFVQKEANASSDSDRLHHFVQYMLAESRIRRDRYAQVFTEERLETPDLLEGMFESIIKRPEENLPATKSSEYDSARESRRSSNTSFPDSRSHSRPASTTVTEPFTLTVDTAVADPRLKTFVPALSPIASMSAVTGRDEMDSRGRAPSRWWESQSNSSNHGDGFDILKRSKRESKYMSAALENEQLPSFEHTFAAGASSSQQLPVYGENEYPPEKIGWHEPAASTPQPIQYPPTPHSAPFTPDPRKLDISRLITLPPPYPRHHPAVNNSHPDLAELRNTVRSLHDLDMISESKEKFETEIRQKRERSKSWCDHQKFMHDQDMQFRIEHGEITQQEYDETERDLESKIGTSKKELAQTTFDLYQSAVVTPVHALLSEHISQADAAFSGLVTRLDSDARTHSPNLPQEAGDEKPELLEKLTTLKWLFEAREALYREKHILLTQRNDYYKNVITTPYALARNTQKLADADAFFAGDARKRQSNADTATLHRWKELQAVIEKHVTRGVEVQLSAFWDIAPPMQALLQRIPDASSLSRFEILIPRHEVDENPAYWQHPLRYLYSVLAHAGASSRQFVDGQISLWCLLQEVREGCVGARWRAREAQRRETTQGREGLDREDETERSCEMQQGVEDLKERVGAVEGQWVEGLGGEIGRVREAVREYLESSGGWDEELEGGE